MQPNMHTKQNMAAVNSKIHIITPGRVLQKWSGAVNRQHCLIVYITVHQLSVACGVSHVSTLTFNLHTLINILKSVE